MQEQRLQAGEGYTSASRATRRQDKGSVPLRELEHVCMIFMLISLMMSSGYENSGAASLFRTSLFVVGLFGLVAIRLKQAKALSR